MLTPSVPHPRDQSQAGPSSTETAFPSLDQVSTPQQALAIDWEVSPTDLASASVDETTLTLNWTAATDNVAVTDYEVFQSYKFSCIKRNSIIHKN